MADTSIEMADTKLYDVINSWTQKAMGEVFAFDMEMVYRADI